MTFSLLFFFFFQAEDGIRDHCVTGVQTCALPISDCRFIHIWRNGLEVARSIEAMSTQGRWFRPDQYRWNMLAEYAQSMPETAQLPALCQSDYEKGLLEWRVSTEAATSFVGRLPQD